MRLTLQHIIGAVIGGAVSGLFFYALGAHDGKQQAALKAAQAVTQAIQNRAGINERIDNMDSVALCIELGGVRDQCQHGRRSALNRKRRSIWLEMIRVQVKALPVTMPMGKRRGAGDERSSC